MLRDKIRFSDRKDNSNRTRPFAAKVSCTAKSNGSFNANFIANAKTRNNGVNFSHIIGHAVSYILEENGEDVLSYVGLRLKRFIKCLM